MPPATAHRTVGQREPLSAGSLIGGAYLLDDTLKAGHGVDTLRATQVASGQPVVLKLVPSSSVSPATLLRLEHDAHTLQQLDAPHLQRVLAFGRDGEWLYQATRFVPGATLEARLAQGPLSVRDTLAVGRSILLALQAAHRQGVLHRAIKPCNVVVPEQGPLSSATLIDFGLSRTLQLSTSAAEDAAAVRYVSPEQAGLLAYDVGERSDLYSLGAVLFECLSGRPAFGGESMSEVLRAHLTARLPPLRELGVSAPRALEEILRRLLRKDPRDRYQTVQGVLEDFDALAQALDRGEAEPSLVIGLHDRRGRLTEATFIGRDAELASLEAQLSRAQAGQGPLVLLEGGSGAGKTRLLDELASGCAQAGALVFRAKGLDQAATRPFQLLTELGRQLLSLSSSDPTFALALRQRIGPHQDAVAAALPELRPLLEPTSTGPLGQEAHGEARSLAAFTALLSALGSPERPAVVLLDDCQWADRMTCNLLAQWHTDDAPRHVLLLAAFRAEDVPSEHLLRKTQPVLHLSLRPLGEPEVRHLLESMAGRLPPEAISVVSGLAEGNPFLAAALLEGLVESGALAYGNEGWQTVPEAMAEVRSSARAAALLERRLTQLPPAALRLLSAGAVAGKEFGVDAAAALAGQSPSEALAGLDEARRRNLVWVDSGGAKATFVHDKLREAVLGRLNPEVRRSLHLACALRLESEDPERVFELSFHFDAAEVASRAFPYAQRAAQTARAQHDLELAERHYRIAQRGAAGMPSDLRGQLAEALGEVLMLLGRYADATRELEAALQMAPSKLDRARILGRMGDLAFKQGRAQEAAANIETALRLLGRRVPRHKLGFALALFGAVLIQVLHTKLPRLFLAKRRLEQAEADMLAVRLFLRLQYPYFYSRGLVPTLWTHFRMLNLVERFPPTPDLAEAYAGHAVAMSSIPLTARALTYGERARAYAQQLSSAWGLAHAHHFFGLALYTGSRFEEAVTECRKAARLYERIGDRWEWGNATNHVCYALNYLGRLSEAAELARRTYFRAAEIGGLHAMTAGAMNWAIATNGRVPPDVLARVLDTPQEDVVRYQAAVVAQGIGLLRQGAYDQAAAALEAEWKRIDGRFRNEYVARVPALLTTALRSQAESLPALAIRRRHQVLKRAKTIALRALKLARKFQNHLPHALRELALVEALLGRPERAWPLLEESLAVAEHQHSRVQHALSLLERGRLRVALSLPGGEDDISSARLALRAMSRDLELDALATIGRPQSHDAPTLSIADRFSSTLDVGRRIASALTREAVFSAVQSAALALLRAERCLVLELSSADSSPRVVAGDGTASFGHAVVQRAAASLGPVAFSASALLQQDEAAALLGERSVLCAPFFVRGQLAGCFYASHREVDDLFGDEELRLARFIATLAGAALENAEGFAEAESLSRVLEQRVSERTAELEAANHQMQATLTKLRATQEQLLQMAITDELTGLFTRRYLHEVLRQHFESFKRVPGRLGCLLLDVDHFKRINDELGHQEGDDVLHDIATVLRRAVRSSDIVGRYGGEEFVILLPDTDLAGAHAVAEKVRRAVEEKVRSGRGPVTVSIGAGAFEAKACLHGTTPPAELAAVLLKRVDEALYRAKSAGRNRVELWRASDALS